MQDFRSTREETGNPKTIPLRKYKIKDKSKSVKPYRVAKQGTTTFTAEEDKDKVQGRVQGRGQTMF